MKCKRSNWKSVSPGSDNCWSDKPSSDPGMISVTRFGHTCHLPFNGSHFPLKWAHARLEVPDVTPDPVFSRTLRGVVGVVSCVGVVVVGGVRVVLATSFQHRQPVREIWAHTWWRHQMETFSALLGHLCGEFTGHRWIPCTEASDAQLWGFSLICAWINGWVNNRGAGDLRRHRAHYDVTVMIY